MSRVAFFVHFTLHRSLDSSPPSLPFFCRCGHAFCYRELNKAISWLERDATKSLRFLFRSFVLRSCQDAAQLDGETVLALKGQLFPLLLSDSLLLSFYSASIAESNPGPRRFDFQLPLFHLLSWIRAPRPRSSTPSLISCSDLQSSFISLFSGTTAESAESATRRVFDQPPSNSPFLLYRDLPPSEALCYGISASKFSLCFLSPLILFRLFSFFPSKFPPLLKTVVMQ